MIDAVTDRPTGARVRSAAFALLAVALLVAIWFQRETIGSAIGQLSTLSSVAIVALVALAFYERWSRADIVRTLLGDVTIGRAATIHDVGTAVSKGIPLGGALGTALRWTIARDASVATPRFATMLISYGIATTMISWVLPLVAMLVDMTQRQPSATDWLITIGIVAVVTAMATFWALVLRSERLERLGTAHTGRIWKRIVGRFPSASDHDPASGIAVVRAQLLAIGRRPLSLLVRTAAAQACGAVILLVALRAIGVGDELGTTEFFRVFFLAHLLGTFAPTPGGVGVVEAGMTGALVAAGVDTAAALAGVLVYRFLTYVLPIILGAGLYLTWRTRSSALASGDRVRAPLTGSATLEADGAPLDPAVPDVPCVEDQGLRQRRDAVRDDGVGVR